MLKVRVPWTDEHIKTCIDQYELMLSKEIHKLPYQKAPVVRELANLTGHSKGSIEFFMCNISAAKKKAGSRYINGWKPRDNYNKKIDAAIQIVLALLIAA